MKLVCLSICAILCKPTKHPPWDVDRMSSLPWPVGADDMQDSVLGQNPFDTEGLSLLAL